MGVKKALSQADRSMQGCRIVASFIMFIVFAIGTVLLWSVHWLAGIWPAILALLCLWGFISHLTTANWYTPDDWGDK